MTTRQSPDKSMPLGSPDDGKNSDVSPTRSNSEKPKRRLRSDSVEDTSIRSRPKRRAASSVRFGSYRDVDAVDFSLLEHFRYDDHALQQQIKARKSMSSTSAGKKKASSNAVLKRRSLVSSKSKPSAKTKPMTAGNSMSAGSHNLDNLSRSGFYKSKMGSKISGSALLNLLPPVLLSRTQGTGFEGLTPSSLRYMSSRNGGMVDIFNRKTGRVMKGEDGVHIKELAATLRNHSEYEPIVPREPITESGSQEYRQARTSVTGRVREDILPQTAIRESNVEGRTVLITGGSHKGLFGKIDSCIPGNWYVISDIFTDDTLDLDIVVHADNLKLMSASFGRSSQEEKSNADKNDQHGQQIIKTMESARLRIEALEEQKDKLLSETSKSFKEANGKAAEGSPKDDVQPISKNINNTARVEAELKRIDREIKDTRDEIEAHKLSQRMIMGSD